MASPRTKPPFRAEHVGSFPRPERLMEARQKHADGALDLAGLRKVEDDCIAEIVALQERVGIGAITDGEYRRFSWRDRPFEAIDGFTRERKDADFIFTLFDGSKRRAGSIPDVVSKLKLREPMAAEHFELLKPMTKGLPKANLPTPSVTHFFRGDAMIDKSVYPDRQQYFADVTAIYRQEIADLGRRGCTYLQMDEVPVALLCDPDNQEIVRSRGEDPDELIDLYIGAINDCIRDRPDGMTVCVHMCRGNMGHGMADAGYDKIAERMFNQLDVDGFFLEYDTPRAGDFAPLRFMPKGKIALLGLLTTKKREVEPADALKARIGEAAKVLDIDQLALCPQCGFSSNAGTGRLNYGEVEAKLARIVEVAADVWG